MKASLNDRRRSRARQTHGRRRRYPRTRLGVGSFYQSAQRCLVAAKLDLNLRGAFIPTTAPDAPGTRTLLRLELPGSPSMLRVTGRVVWCNQQSGRGPLGMGIRFDSLDGWQIKRVASLLLRTAGFHALSRQAERA